MAYQLTIGGGDMVIRRDLGTPVPVQGFHTNTMTYGGQLSTPVFGYVRMQVGDGESSAMNAATRLWLNVLGAWKITTMWRNVAGVWKVIQPFYNVLGIWK